MSNMTGLGRYQKGLELEKEGLTGAQIAAKLGYANAQGWYDAKYRYNSRTAAFNERAAETNTKTVPTMEVPEPTTKPPQKPQFPPAAVVKVEAPVDTTTKKPGLKVETLITAESKALRYRLNGTQLLINKHNNRHSILVLSIEEALTMLEEIKELLKA